MTFVIFGTPPSSVVDRLSLLAPRLEYLTKKEEGVNRPIQVFGAPDGRPPRIINDDDHLIVVLGTPEFNRQDIFETRTTAEAVTILKDRTADIDSTFFVFLWEHDQAGLAMFSDRFGSKVIYYFLHPEFCLLSTELNLLCLIAPGLTNQNIDKEAIFEFLWFRRLFGQKTYLKDVKCIPPAAKSYLSRRGELSISRYWIPGHNEEKIPSFEWVERIERGIRNGVENSLARPGQTGLMLSGGLDSRALLAVAKNRVIGITNTPSENQELRVARELAAINGASHLHILRPDNYIDQIFPDAMLASNGATLFYECQFLGYREGLRELADRIQMGLFLDIFFCGHYMPKRHRRLGNRQSVHFIADRVDEKDFAINFINRVSYRLKTTPLETVINPLSFRRGMDAILETVQQISQEGSDSGFGGVKLWEYMHLTNIGRHYSMLMAKSLEPYIPVDLPVLTIENYHTALSMPERLKLNWSAYLDALCRLDEATMKVRNANLNSPAYRSLRSQTYLKIVKSLINIARPKTYQLSPNVEDRSWPLVKDTIIKPSRVRNEIKDMLHGGRILDLGMLDVERVRQLLDLTQDGKQDHSVFLNQLLTVEKGLLSHL